MFTKKDCDRYLQRITKITLLLTYGEPEIFSLGICSFELKSPMHPRSLSTIKVSWGGITVTEIMGVGFEMSTAEPWRRLGTCDESTRIEGGRHSRASMV